MSHRTRNDCRLCRSKDLSPVIELAPTPPANEFLPLDYTGEQEKFPLYLVRCVQCGHVQLPVVIDPDRLFGNYVYVSGTSPVFVDHFKKYAHSMIGSHDLSPGDLIVEVGSNDGTMLRFFRDAKMRVLGVDPAKAIAAKATESGIETIARFFDQGLAKEIREDEGQASLVVANNVFAHADDLHEIAIGARKLLKDSGRFVFEVQYVVDLVEKCLFDMIYHEHLSYHSLTPLVPFFDSVGMSLVDAEYVTTHGGSVRCTAAPGRHLPKSDRLCGMMKVEQAALTSDAFAKFGRHISEVGNKVRTFFDAARQSGDMVAAYGAPAKATTLSHQFGISAKEIAYVIDDSPWKQGLLTPGSKIPVVPSSELKKHPPDYLFVFAWNFADRIIDNNPGHRFVVPLPEFKMVSA